MKLAMSLFLFCRAAASSNLSVNGTRQPVSRCLQGKPRATGRAPVMLIVGPGFEVVGKATRVGIVKGRSRR